MRQTENFSLDDLDLSAPLNDRWQTILSTTHLPWSTRLTGPTKQFNASIRRRWIDDLALVDCTCGISVGSRQRSQITETDGEYFVILINRGGREYVTQDDVTVEIRPGDAVAWDSSKPAYFDVREPLMKRSLIIPRDAIAEVGGTPWAMSGSRFPSDSPTTRLLTSYLDSLDLNLPNLSHSAAIAARNATLELLLGALRPDNNGAGGSGSIASPALRESIIRYIDSHLLDPQLSPDTIAITHGVSVRTVNRAFRATGQTVSGAIRSRRLSRARVELATTTNSVAAIANRLGFSDASHLSRMFKTHYGVSPRDFRAESSAERKTAGV